MPTMQTVAVKKPTKTAVLGRRTAQTATITQNFTNETGLYYYGARYLDPKTSRWLSGDPALGEYVPSAPVNDEVKKRNGNLPGQGGVFNYVNLHVYHYAGNNPVKYTDPDGEIFVAQGTEDFQNQVTQDLSQIENALINSGNNDALRNFRGLKEDNNNIIIIKEGFIDSYQSADFGKRSNSPYGNRLLGTITYDSKYTGGNITRSGKTDAPSFIHLSHEIGHAIDDSTGMSLSNWSDFLFRRIDGETYFYRQEDSAINFENIVREGFFGTDIHNRLPAVDSNKYEGHLNIYEPWRIQND
jgi:hypothetical protein